MDWDIPWQTVNLDPDHCDQHKRSTRDRSLLAYDRNSQQQTTTPTTTTTVSVTPVPFHFLLSLLWVPVFMQLCFSHSPLSVQPTAGMACSGPVPGKRLPDRIMFGSLCWLPCLTLVSWVWALGFEAIWISYRPLMQVTGFICLHVCEWMCACVCVCVCAGCWHHSSDNVSIYVWLFVDVRHREVRLGSFSLQ